MRTRHLVLLVVLGLALLAPAATSAQPGSKAPVRAVAAMKVKPCKRKHGESKRHWLNRGRGGKFKGGERRTKLKRRCRGARVPRRRARAGGGQPPPPAGPAPAPAPPAPAPAQSDVEKVT